MYYFTSSNNVISIPYCIITKIKLDLNMINFNGSIDQKLGKICDMKFSFKKQVRIFILNFVLECYGMLDVSNLHGRFPIV